MKQFILSSLGGALGMLVMFLVICYIPEIEDFLKSKKK